MVRKLDRCSGHCCENFSLPLSPAELRKRSEPEPEPVKPKPKRKPKP
jgi:hypothetical protein